MKFLFHHEIRSFGLGSFPLLFFSNSSSSSSGRLLLDDSQDSFELLLPTLVHESRECRGAEVAIQSTCRESSSSIVQGGHGRENK